MLHTNDTWQRVDLTEPEQVQDTEPRRPQRRMSYFELHPERRHMHMGGDGGDMLGQYAQVAGGHTILRLSHSGMTRPRASIHLGRRHQPPQSRTSPNLIPNVVILTPPLAPSPPPPPFACVGPNTEPTDTDIYSAGPAMTAGGAR
jgi:hypothetical protein